MLDKRNLKPLTGVSYAIHATIFGQRGARVSGRVRANSMSASAASNPPILQRGQCIQNCVAGWTVVVNIPMPT